MKAKLQALSQLSRAEPSFEHFHEFFRQITEEKNERGAALMLAANVENALLYVIRRVLVIKQGEDKGLFRYDAPIGTFEAKIRIGYALDIFGPQTKTNLDGIKGVRNAFAHAIIPITFQTPQVSDVCALLMMPEILPPRAVRSDTGEPVTSLPHNSPPRLRFQKVCEAVGHNLFVWDWSISSTPTLEPPDSRHEVKLRPKPLP